MKAVGAEQLIFKDFSKSTPGRILIKVKVSAINRMDIVSREGKSGYMANPILVNEVSGEVVEREKVELMAD
ncbi:alcohol dehydrogenase catalytic domain-containing protein [Peribacillus simplex]|uniref:alcohol dehydrogenase catalytic domain-containing protein n=1 Tax=Peribacillus simplex TaxID=1478 RepID=UPI00366AB657